LESKELERISDLKSIAVTDFNFLKDSKDAEDVRWAKIINGYTQRDANNDPIVDTNGNPVKVKGYKEEDKTTLRVRYFITK
jgi:hypothetical protein